MWSRFVGKSNKKVVDIETKVNLQLSSKTREIDSKYPKSYKPLAKKDKNKTNWEYWDGNKTKSYNLPLANSQFQIQASKKNKHYENRQRGHLATKINTIKVGKKNKNKAQNLSHIECYTYKQKNHYINRCLKKPKNK